MIDYNHWIARLNNVLEIQKDRSYELMSMNFTRQELIELRMMIESIKEIMK